MLELHTTDWCVSAESGRRCNENGKAETSILRRVTKLGRAGLEPATHGFSVKPWPDNVGHYLRFKLTTRVFILQVLHSFYLILPHFG